MLTDVTPRMQIAKDEICGPVATVIKYGNEAEAVAFANAGFGLAGSVTSLTSRRSRGLVSAGNSCHPTTIR